jgi:plastocyanin
VRRTGYALAAATLALLVAPLGPATGASTAATAVTTSIRDFAFQPEIEVGVGGQVTWTNADPATHTVTASDGSFDSGALAPGGSFAATFTEAGSVTYFCAVHPSMIGTIIVSAGTEADPAATPDAATADATILHRTIVLDTHPLGIGGPALTLLVPDGWIVQGGPVWRHDFSNLATLEARVTSPDLRYGVEFFPIFPQIWRDGGISFFPPGSRYLGNEVRAPIRDAARFVEELVLPAYRAGFSARVIDRLPMPHVAAAYAQASLPGTEAVAERVLTEHFVDGERMLEEFTVVLTFTPNPLVPGALLWSPQQLYSVRAPEADFEALHPIMQVVATSPIVDLRWYAGYEYVLGLSQRNGLEAIRAAGAAAGIIAEANAQISDTIIRGYEARQAINDDIFEQMSQTIRGIETYRDPWDGATLELPNGFQYVYASAEGSVVLTDEPGFDPVRAFPEETWQAAELER